jgi:hypothetical protein
MLKEWIMAIVLKKWMRLTIMERSRMRTMLATRAFLAFPVFPSRIRTRTHTDTHTHTHTHTHTNKHTRTHILSLLGSAPRVPPRAPLSTASPPRVDPGRWAPLRQPTGHDDPFSKSTLHCCYNVETLLLHCCYTVVTLLLYYCYTVVTLLVHCYQAF